MFQAITKIKGLAASVNKIVAIATIIIHDAEATIQKVVDTWNADNVNSQNQNQNTNV